ncbi:SGNH/GDSL hydrolase family protein [Luteolibacter pohnpeiensis]|uniref:SGNH/GDSL hydrolase family protein n=1 Tax=Luteolibacter pohnpeiensis TaxID=454153 RepID=A0A934S359_9BACT|nr:SGNH/GDSL hydrolase family protein [Luteolibacter pohnpeiensis]MBK1882310.1 SGNH/GDSL hydrolase family protein [Luteolibacter pohnpeiensis]
MMRHLSLRIVSLLVLVTPLARADYAFRDGDRVAFLGDSITAARGYTKIIEHYTLMRFPDRKITFVNAGVGGDTASGCLKRLDRDVFDRGATVVTVAFGINDIGWGTKADDEHRKAYLDGIRTIIARCKEHHVRPIICSAAITAEDPDTAEKGYLQGMMDEGLELARSLGAETVDVQRTMREIQRRVLNTNASKANAEEHDHLHIKDGIHLAELGDLAMAYSIIKGLGAPEEVSTATIDADTGKIVSSSGCKISEVAHQPGELEFTRLDEGLPVNFGPLSQLKYQWVPIPDGINGYRLKIANLAAGKYEIKAGGRPLGTASAQDLAAGINLSSMTGNGWEPGGPWDVQSNVEMQLVEARDRLFMAQHTEEQYPMEQPNLSEATKHIGALEKQLIENQREVAKPRPYHFVISKVADDS